MSTTETELYELLGVSRDADGATIKSAYRKLAMKHHPDRGGDAAVWSQIQKAYDTLCDLQRRAVYDRTQGESAGGAERQFTQKFGEGSFDLSEGATRTRKGGMDILKQVLPCAPRSPPIMPHHEILRRWRR